MSASKLKIVRELVDEDGVPAFAIRRWDRVEQKYVWLNVPITDDELKQQLREPVRLSHEPTYWLYRNRFVLQSDTGAEPDDYVDALHAALCDDSNYHLEGKARVFAHLIGDPPGGENEVVDVMRRAMMGLFPKRYSELLNERPWELVLRIKHAVLSEERALDKLRREVEAFEAHERMDPTARAQIPGHVRVFVWQRDGGRCVNCGCNERLEYDHIIPLARGGSNTERNLQLLCEICNRQKGSSIV